MTNEKIKVVFLHLELGIGGAEQLVLQLARSSVALNHEILLTTTRCEPNHCFSIVGPGGALHSSLRVWGNWIPSDLRGYARTLCSTIRLLYLTCILILHSTEVDVIVVDVLPSPLPFLAHFTKSSTLYYCHFPDKLLKQTLPKSAKPSTSSSSSSSPLSHLKPIITNYYRVLMNGIEAWGMRAADTIVVNSLFTRQVTFDSFPGLSTRTQLPVLYPALDTRSLDLWRTSQQSTHIPSSSSTPTMIEKRYRIVSLNRYERKKNLPLLLQAVDWIQQSNLKMDAPVRIPEIVIAGGYDVKNEENIVHLQELRELASDLKISVDFRCSISDADRAELLHTALVVIYTPSNEHFGIVPLEAMYAGTPVIAVNNGGPTESIIHKHTGFLCDESPAAFGAAIMQLLRQPELARSMGEAGRKHVIDRFGEDRMMSEWQTLINDTCKIGKQRRMKKRRWWWIVVLLFVLIGWLTLHHWSTR